MKSFVLFLFLTIPGSGPHTDIAATSATFKNQAACEQALVTAIESQGDGVAAIGFCTPTTVKPVK